MNCHINGDRKEIIKLRDSYSSKSIREIIVEQILIDAWRENNINAKDTANTIIEEILKKIDGMKNKKVRSREYFEAYNDVKELLKS